MNPSIHETPIDAKIDAVARRQSARFLHRLQQAGASSPSMERDYMRSVRFLCTDIKAAIRETYPEAINAQSSTR
jgi:hypothetical protein